MVSQRNPKVKTPLVHPAFVLQHSRKNLPTGARGAASDARTMNHCLDAAWKMGSTKSYRIRDSITVVMLEGPHEVFRGVRIGSILIPTSGPDSAGMIEARYQGGLVRVFQRDLDEASDQVEADVASS
jgi:hypothetical protein